MQQLAQETQKLNEARRTAGLDPMAPQGLQNPLTSLQRLNDSVSDATTRMNASLLAKDGTAARFADQLKANPQAAQVFLDSVRKQGVDKLGYAEAHVAQKLLNDPEMQKKLAAYNFKT